MQLLALRWPDGVPTCPKCGSTKSWPRQVVNRTHGKVIPWTGWRCGQCRKDYNERSGTFLQGAALTDTQLVTFAQLYVGGCPGGIAGMCRSMEVNEPAVKRLLTLAVEAGMQNATDDLQLLAGLLSDRR